MAIRRRIVAAAAAAALMVGGFAAGSSAATAASGASASAAADDELPVFTTQGPIIDRFTDETWNPGNEFIFPSVFHAGEYLDDPLGEWYVYYAPHDAPGGINLMYADSLDGPWTHYDANPIVSNVWDGIYDVSHVSAPDAVWNEATSQVFLYFHGENTTDRYATSSDGVSFDYGGVVMTTEQFGQNATETSYNRIFENPFPENGWEYAMFFMVNDTANVRRIGLAYSHDLIDWEAQPGWVVEPTAVEGTNVAGPELWEWNGTHYVLYGSSSGTIFAKRLDENLRSIGDPLPLYIPSPFPPEEGRSSSPQIVEEDGVTHLIFEIGGRSGTTIAHALLDPEGERDPLNNHPEDPMYAQCAGEGSDEFEGDALGADWSVVRDGEGQRVEDGDLVLSSPPTSIDGATIPLLPVPDGAWEVTTELDYAPEAKYQQAGLVLYRDDANNAKLVWSFAQQGQRFDFTWRNNGKDRFDNWTWEDSVFPPSDMGGTVWLRMSSDGEWITASLSTDGEKFIRIGQPIDVPVLAPTGVGVSAFRGATDAPDTEARFDWLRFTPDEAELAACAGEDPGTDPGDPGTDPEEPAPELQGGVGSASVAQGQTQTVSATGFVAGEKVSAVMHSDPLSLGTKAADEAGAVEFSWTIPADAEVGTHTVTLTGAESGSVSIEFEVTAAASGGDGTGGAGTGRDGTADDASGGLAVTGVDLTPALAAGALLLMAGAGLAFASRRRRSLRGRA